MLQIDQDALCALARTAGRAILDIYATAFSVEEKADHSPITQADRAANAIIVEGLKAVTPLAPILSEESARAEYAARKSWRRFWLVDPLDGTKEFVKRNGEFTVNIALVEDGVPIFGVVYVPVTDTLYAGGPGRGALRQIGGASAEPIAVARPVPGEPLVAVTSRSHPDERLDVYLERYPNREVIVAGSSVKFCRVAEGAAHLYIRFNKTWEWDTAAGHAVVLGAGGSFTNLEGGVFPYNKPDLVNGGFVAKSWKD
ncbi:3'(2'),5'-bisphosphate nucleotidase CysQ [Fundidesulfovibrio butyratiphilus]